MATGVLEGAPVAGDERVGTATEQADGVLVAVPMIEVAGIADDVPARARDV